MREDSCNQDHSYVSSQTSITGNLGYLLRSAGSDFMEGGRRAWLGRDGVSFQPLRT